MNKTPTLPVAKIEASPASAPVAVATPVKTTPVESVPKFGGVTTPVIETESPKSEAVKIDLNKQVIKEAITKSKAIIAEGKTKVEAAMLIYEALKAEDKDVVIAAFVEGATLTEKGAITYFYNCRRKSKKLAKPV
jgi:hypothetical protein